MANKEWTIIIQISGENNLILDSITAFDEIARSGSTDKINFVAIMDRMDFIGDFSDKYKHLEYLKNKDLAKPSVYLISKDEVYSKATPKKIFANDDLNDPDNRESIYKYIIEKFPANHFGFIYKGHGQAGGTDVENDIMIAKVFEVEKDEYTNDGKLKTKKINERISLKKNSIGNEFEYMEFFTINDEEVFPPIVLALFYKKIDDSGKPFLTYPGLQKSLINAFGNRGLSFVLLDCCWGMVLENIHQFKDTTEYFVASPDEMPALGIGYNLFCDLIVKKPSIKPDELAKLLVSVFYTQRFDDYNDPTDIAFKNMGVSLTCIQTKSYRDKLFSAFVKLIDHLTINIPDYADSIFKSINNCKDFTYSNPHVYKIYNLDFTWFLENMIFYNKNDEKLKILCYNLLLETQLYLIRGFVSNNYKETQLGERFIGGKGITITLPKTKSYFNLSVMGDEFSKEILFFKDASWEKFLLKYYAYCEKFKILFNSFVSTANTKEVINGLIDTDNKALGTPENFDALVESIKKLKLDTQLSKINYDDVKLLSDFTYNLDNTKVENYLNKLNSGDNKINFDTELFINNINTGIESKWKKLETSDE